MPASYTGVPSHVSLATPMSGTLPSSGDPRTAAGVDAPIQTILDYAEAIRLLVVGSGLPLFEGFESVTFPPAAPVNAWAAPSPRFGSDLAYQRDTSNPITGTASANRNSGQSASTNSSIGLSGMYLTVPSRIAFVFDLLCNASFGDHLDFFIDGVLTGKWSCTTNTNVSAGRFVSDVLREGAHTFDWRFVRGGSVSVANEKARIDAVNIIPESVWGDRANRYVVDDEFVRQSGSTDGAWGSTFTGHAGSVAFGFSGGDAAFSAGGTVQVLCSNINSGDSEILFLGAAADKSFLGINASFFPFMEALISLPVITNTFAEFGIAGVVAGAVDTANNKAAWVYDSAVGTDWRFTTVLNGTATANPTGIAATVGAVRLGLTGCKGLTNGTGWLGSINGLSVPAAGANHMGSSLTQPSAINTYAPYFRVGSRAATAQSMVIDYFRAFGFRAAALIG